MTPSGINPATFRFVVQCLNHCGISWKGLWKIKRNAHMIADDVEDIPTRYLILLEQVGP
jgi:hypothetical protein